ncbi:MAG TPA: hypothetical protein PLG55_07950 [Methanospirillum sp.]|uniref:hypothetical protein n=1 Tax=Methanospirillum sp. TaxID=45200 RepID=UPI002C490B12|nr:hypothetical protein [Methanospirillum sp.]HPY60640.1 hypothetical protein [Methanospirillum sp.]
MGNTLDINISKEEIKKAIDLEFSQLQGLRTRTKKLDIQELGYRDCYSLATVATDGGENNLAFEPLNLEIIRVVDSEGIKRIQKIIPVTTDPYFFNHMFEEIGILKRFLTRLGIENNDAPYFLPIEKKTEQKAYFRTIIKKFRDILTWAVLLEIAWNPQQKPTLLLRDGLLRSMSVLENELLNVTKNTIEADLNLFLFSNIILDGKKIEDQYAFSYLILRRHVAESLSVESTDQFVDITKNGKKLVKSKDIDNALKKLGISPTKYLGETDFDYLLMNFNTLKIKKERKMKVMELRAQKT